MYIIIIIATFFYIISQLTKYRVSNDEINRYVKDTYVYSGIHEESYKKFYSNIRMAQEYMSNTFLEKALHHLNEIPLYMTPLDPDIQNEIAELSQKIAISFEKMVLKDAINNNTYFKPKYI